MDALKHPKHSKVWQSCTLQEKESLLSWSTLQVAAEESLARILNRGFFNLVENEHLPNKVLWKYRMPKLAFKLWGRCQQQLFSNTSSLEYLSNNFFYWALKWHPTSQLRWQVLSLSR